jgi:hypothetical protein
MGPYKMIQRSHIGGGDDDGDYYFIISGKRISLLVLYYFENIFILNKLNSEQIINIKSSVVNTFYYLKYNIFINIMKLGTTN